MFPSQTLLSTTTSLTPLLVVITVLHSLPSSPPSVMKLLTLLAFALTFVSVPFLADAKRCRAHHAYHSGHSGPHFQAFGAGRQEHHAPHPSHQHTTATASTRPLTSATIHKGAKTEGNAAKSPGHWVPQGSVPSSMHRHLPKPIHRPVSTTIMTHSYQSVGNGHPTPSRFSSSPVPPASESKSSSSSVSSSTYTTLALTSSTRSTNGQPVPARFSTSPLRAVSETTSPTVQSSSLQQPSSTHRAPSSTTATRSTVSVPQASSKGISATSSTHTTGSTSSRAPHPSPPGQQPCRSSHWDFRSLPRSSIISNWDTTSAAASLADFIDLSGTPAGTTWALTSEGLVLYLVKPKESGTAALAATMSTTFVLKMGAKVTAEMQTSGVGGAVSTLTMYHPGQDEIDIELAGGVYKCVAPPVTPAGLDANLTSASTPQHQLLRRRQGPVRHWLGVVQA